MTYKELHKLIDAEVGKILNAYSAIENTSLRLKGLVSEYSDEELDALVQLVDVAGHHAWSCKSAFTTEQYERGKRKEKEQEVTV
jgi:hypothetical protein